MPYPQRIHVPGGLYYVSHRRNSHRPLFLTDDDYVCFEAVFSHAVEQFGVCAHAFCWQPDAIYLALQVSTTPLSRFIQTVASNYVRRLKLKAVPRVPLFLHRYEAWLVDIKLLPQLLRLIHQCACATDTDLPSEDFPWSSHPAYLGQTSLPWLTTHVALQAFSHDRDVAVERYAAYMKTAGSASHPKQLIEHGCRDPRVVGDASFTISIPRHLQIKRTTQRLEDVIETVLSHEQLTREELLSSRSATLARALVTFHAVEPGIAKYSEVARALHRSVATLQAGVRHYCTSPLHAHLFRLGALRGIGPTANLRG